MVASTWSSPSAISTPSSRVERARPLEVGGDDPDRGEARHGPDSTERAARCASRRPVASLVAEAVVKTAVAVLPELPRVRHDEVAAPRRGRGTGPSPSSRSTSASRSSRTSRDSSGSLCADATRSDLRAARAGREVGVRLLLPQPHDVALDAHLATERRPVEEERRARVHEQLAALARLVVAEEDEAALVEALRGAPCARTASRSGVAVASAIASGTSTAAAASREPAAELLERIGGEVAAPELGLRPSSSASSPRSIATRTSSARVESRSFCMIRARCVSAVRTERKSCFEISWFV